MVGKYGRGVFSIVLRAQDLQSVPEGSTQEPADVAIKVLRSNEHMYKCGMREMEILVCSLAPATSEANREGGSGVFEFRAPFQRENVSWLPERICRGAAASEALRSAVCKLCA